MIPVTRISQFLTKIPYTSNIIRNLSVQLKTNEEIVYDKLRNENNGIVTIGLNRPKARNAFGLNLVTEFEETLNTINNDKDVRVVIIRSLIPGIFCAGADLKERKKLKPDEVAKFVKRLRGLMNTINSLAVPVIAALDGTALGGGLELALACDIRTAATTTKLGLVETKLAIIPGAGGSQRLPRIIGPALAKELIFTAKILDGQEAKDYGFVNHAVKQNETGDAAFRKALEIAREIVPNGPIAVRIAKEAIDKGIEFNLEQGLIFEKECYDKIIPTKDRLEGLKAFAEKRAPKYIGE